MPQRPAMIMALMLTLPPSAGASFADDCRLLSLATQLEKASSRAELDTAVREALKQRSDFTSRLIYILGSEAPSDVKIRACAILGYYREERAIQALVKLVALEAPIPTEIDKIPLWLRYPCMEALAGIGKPAEAELVRLLMSTEREDLRGALLGKLIFIERERTADILREALNGARREEAARLEEALASLKQ